MAGIRLQHGQRREFDPPIPARAGIFFGREFGKQGTSCGCRMPSVSAAHCPQIMAQCGMDWFMTTKMAWNDTNCMPHDLTRWRGIDGTEVLAYFISTKDYDKRPDRNPKPSFNTTYNGLLNPRQVMGCWQRFQDKGADPGCAAMLWLRRRRRRCDR